MSIDTLQRIAATNQWAALAPEIILGLLALALLLLELVLPKKAAQDFLPRLTILGLVAVFLWVVQDFKSAFLGAELFGGLITQTSNSQAFRLFFLGASALVAFMAGIVLPRHRVAQVEFYHILLVATAALMLLGQSSHFAMVFVALETVTVSLYVLVSYFRENSLSLEAGLKYLIMGALSSAMLLFGIVLLYGAAGNPNLVGSSQHPSQFKDLELFLAANPDNVIALVGAVLVLSGLAFKIGAVPFQIWVPDVYQGAPSPVTAFLAVSSKAAGFAVLLNLLAGPFAPIANVTVPVLSTFAILSMLFGNLAAIPQQSVKRLMGLSGVSHAGFLLMGVVASIALEDAVAWASSAVIFYLVTYLIGSMAVFGVISILAGENDADQDLRHFAGLARRSPFLGGVLAAGVGSLAGIPPLAGFIGKLLIFIAAFQAHLWALLAVAILSVVISIYYYFGWIRAAFFQSSIQDASERSTTGAIPFSTATAIVLGVLAFSAVLLGFYQGPLGAWLTTR